MLELEEHINIMEIDEDTVRYLIDRAIEENDRKIQRERLVRARSKKRRGTK